MSQRLVKKEFHIWFNLDLACADFYKPVVKNKQTTTDNGKVKHWVELEETLGVSLMEVWRALG